MREKKASAYGKYNFPGGYLERGESIADGAKREVREEVGFDIELAGQADEILECHWLSIEDVKKLPDELLRNSGRIR